MENQLCNGDIIPLYHSKVNINVKKTEGALLPLSKKNYLYLRFLAASDFFFFLTLGFS